MGQNLAESLLNEIRPESLAFPPLRPVSDPRDIRGLRVLYTGPTDGTAYQRARSLRTLGAEVDHIRSGIPTDGTPTHSMLRVANQFKQHSDLYFANSRLLRRAREREFDLIWVDKGLWLRPHTLRRLRALQPRARIVSYSPDDMGNPGNQSQRYLESLSLYDLHVTTKSYNVLELQALGAREVLYAENAYDPRVHRPMKLSDEDNRYRAEVGFVGAFEEHRSELLLRLAKAGIPVRVRGPEWKRHFKKSHSNLEVIDEWLDDETYPRVINATKINLGFLRKCNRDLQTQRSIEIPACRGFMLAERTAEHARLFQEGEEAEFFEGFEELLAKCRHYLRHDEERQRIAEGGRRRCVDSGYSNEQRLISILGHAMDLPLREQSEKISVQRPRLIPIGLKPQRA